jgi:hypothetical protein
MKRRACAAEYTRNNRFKGDKKVSWLFSRLSIERCLQESMKSMS